MAIIIIVLAAIGVMMNTDLGQEALLVSASTGAGALSTITGVVLLAAVAFVCLEALAKAEWNSLASRIVTSGFLALVIVACFQTGGEWQFLAGLALIFGALVPWFRNLRPFPLPALLGRFRSSPLKILAAAASVYLIVGIFAFPIGRTLGPISSLMVVGMILAVVTTAIASISHRKTITWAIALFTVVGFVFYRSSPIRELPDKTLYSSPVAIDCVDAAAPAGLMLVERTFKCWLDANKDKGGRATMYLVGAAGGGVRAAEWTATVLSELDRQVPDFSKKLFAISAVSGGSLGASVYLGEITERQRRGDCRPSQEGGLSPCARDMLDGEILGPVILSALTSDVISSVAFPITGYLDDRGVALERSLERNWENAYGSNLFGTSLSGLWPKEPWPALILNATMVYRGRIASTSNLGDIDGDGQIFNVGQPTTRVSTAVVNSARFPGITPGGRYVLPWTKYEGRDVPVSPSEAAKSDKKFDYRYFDTLVDGGYIDNYGAASLLALIGQLDEIQCDMLQDQDSELHKQPCWQILQTKRFVRYAVVQITSDPLIPGKCDMPLEIDPGIDSVISDAPDLVSPLLTLMNTRSLAGIDLAKRLKEHVHSIDLNDRQSRTHGIFAKGDHPLNFSYFHFGLGPLLELPQFGSEDTFAELRKYIELQQSGASEEELSKLSRQQMEASFKKEATRLIKKPTFDGRMPPLSWGLSEDSKSAIAKHFKLCGSWAVKHLRRISQEGLFYARDEAR
ncbi:hypothetical protein J2X76_005388 [Neorhizobium sp. 2083]|uniref:hypothetical protein n=1 Tax=Neorhizobium sp. 2083 TaxID=2817762 RepID=UPI0028636222|nr:hypothetical protein [Neorhizobium sp. 2083]MDR6820191.1 hypothetical protein [Neorhizobium sp. 2083]